MQDIQDIYNRMRGKKRELSELRSIYKNALESSVEYQDITKKLQELRERKKQIEAQTQEGSPDFKRMDTLKASLVNDASVISDAALAKVVKGEQVKVTDEHQNEYGPEFWVRFKKMN